MASLPGELLLAVAQHLIPPVPDAVPVASNVYGSSSPTSAAQADHSSLIAALQLSFINTATRRLLTPLIWQEVFIHRSDRLGKLRTLSDYYQRLASSASEIDRLLYPLPFVKVLRVQVSDSYLSLDQEVLRYLIRSGINPENSLHTLVWNAEMLPSPAVWRMLGEPMSMPGLEAELVQKALRKGNTRRFPATIDGLDADIAFQTRRLSGVRIGGQHDDGSRREAGLQDQSRSGRIGREDNVNWSLSGAFGQAPRPHYQPCSRSRYSSSPSPPRTEIEGLQSLTLHCRIFYPGHADMARLRSLRHLKLVSFDSHLLPPHLPALLVSLRRPLRSISMSTSKTSLLHDADLIQRGTFTRLQYLDIYPVTPEWPLAEGLRSAGRSLRGLRIVLDISGSFRNFDELWRDLMCASSDASGTVAASGRQESSRSEVKQSEPAFPLLEWLDVDPFPQQNTAPSFPDFLRRCPRLRFLNGRRIDAVPEGLEQWDFNPDKPSGALPY
ncbi:unnamed protein product [Jaminaea pallidilutea]